MASHRFRIEAKSTCGSHASTLEVLGPDAKAIMARLPATPQSPSNHAANFLRAAMGQETCRSRFAVAGPLCQAMDWP